MTKENQDFPMFAGDYRDILATARDESSIEGSTVEWSLRKTPTSQRVVYKTTPSGITVTGNTFTVHLNSSDTANLSGRYYHKARVTDISGKPFTAMTGYITFEPGGI